MFFCLLVPASSTPKKFRSDVNLDSVWVSVGASFGIGDIIFVEGAILLGDVIFDSAAFGIFFVVSDVDAFVDVVTRVDEVYD